MMALDRTGPVLALVMYVCRQVMCEQWSREEEPKVQMRGKRKGSGFCRRHFFAETEEVQRTINTTVFVQPLAAVECGKRKEPQNYFVCCHKNGGYLQQNQFFKYKPEISGRKKTEKQNLWVNLRKGNYFKFYFIIILPLPTDTHRQWFYHESMNQKLPS